MAVFTPRDREAFDAHWRRILDGETLIARTIVDEGRVAGNIGCWEQDGRLLLGYWIGNEFWGRGPATRALAAFVAEVSSRPIHAWVATTNLGSIACSRSAGS